MDSGVGRWWPSEITAPGCRLPPSVAFGSRAPACGARRHNCRPCLPLLHSTVASYRLAIRVDATAFSRSLGSGTGDAVGSEAVRVRDGAVAAAD